jgi:hypothetical protein
MATVHVQLFKNSYRSFTELLDSEGIEFTRRVQLSEVPMAAGLTIEIVSAIAQATPWGALAIAVVAWMNARKSRKVIITTKDNDVFQLEGYSAGEAERLIAQSKTIAVIDTDGDDET